MVAVRETDDLGNELLQLASTLESLDLKAAEHTGSGADVERDRLVRVLRSYLVPRLRDPSTPLTVVFTGPTGAGKSTLINTVSGLHVSEAGPLRPTTKRPVVLTTEERSSLFESIAGLDCTVAVGKAPVLESMALIDTPDIDSTSLGHRNVAEAMIDNADVVVFVSSALRYADLVPWQILRRAQSRGAEVIHVLNRVNSDTKGAVVDYQSRLVEASFGDELIRIPEHQWASTGQAVPAIAVIELKRRLVAIARDRTRFRNEVVHRVLATTLDQVSALHVTVESDSEWVAGHIDERVSAIRSTANVAALAGSIPLAAIPEPPAGNSRRAYRRWWRRNRLDDAQILDIEESITSSLLGLVESDLLARSKQSRLPSGARHRVSSAIGTWFDEIHAMLPAMSKRRRNLARATVISGVLSARHRDVLARILGIDRDRILGELLDSLNRRITEIYLDHAVDIADSVRSITGSPDPGHLREEAARVVARSHFANA